MLVLEELDLERLNRIKVLLVEKEVKQIDLAKAIGKSANTVASFCNNKSQPRVDDLKKIADYLKVDIRELLVPTMED